jgi:hypothetical protein
MGTQSRRRHSRTGRGARDLLCAGPHKQLSGTGNSRLVLLSKQIGKQIEQIDNSGQAALCSHPENKLRGSGCPSLSRFETQAVEYKSIRVARAPSA